MPIATSLLNWRLATILVGMLVVAASPAQVSAQNTPKQKEAKTATTTGLPFVNEDTYRAIAQFYEYDRNSPLSAQTVEKKDMPLSTREKIVFTGIAGSRVPGYLALPKNRTVSPAILLVDGIYGAKDRWFTDDNWPKGGLVSKALLEAGFAVMALDAVYHGERAAENNFAGPPSPFTYPHQGTQMVVQTAVEYRRAMDYLATRPEIDTSRIGILGLSMGGAITFALSSIDPRIKAAVAGLTPILTLREPKFQPWMPTTFAAHIRSVPFLMFIGTKDSYYTVEQAREVYSRIPSLKKEFISYQTGHEPPVEYVQMLRAWFTKQLNGE